MEVLQTYTVTKYLAKVSYYDLTADNKRLGLIQRQSNDPIALLQEKFTLLLTNDDVVYNYYQLQNLFTQIQINGPVTIYQLIISTLLQKSELIKEAITDTGGQINMSVYLQIWQIYQKDMQKIYHLVKNFIGASRKQPSIFPLIKHYLFYQQIICSQPHLLQDLVANIKAENINSKNITQLIDFINIIDRFRSVNISGIDKDSMYQTIKELVTNTHIINQCCLHLHRLILDHHYQKMTPIPSENVYSTFKPEILAKKLLNKIYQLTLLLRTYADRERLFICYTKFMQSRITNSAYTISGLKREINLIKKIAGGIGQVRAQRLINALTDVVVSRHRNLAIKQAKIVVASEKYRCLGNFDLNIIEPLIIDQTNWIVHNVANLSPIYPIQLQCYLDIISKFWENQSEQSPQEIKWKPTLGWAQLEACLGGEITITIICNILQAIALFYFTDQYTIEQFIADSAINEELAQKIFHSLLLGNIIIETVDNYSINIHYCDTAKLDLRPYFIEAFEEDSL